MEQAMIAASRKSISMAATAELARQSAEFGANREAAMEAAALEAGRHTKVDPKTKEVRSGPRDAA